MDPAALVIDDVTLALTNDGAGWTSRVTVASAEGVDLGAVVAHLLAEAGLADVPSLPSLRVREVGFERGADGTTSIDSKLALPEALAIDLRRLPLVPDSAGEEYVIAFTELGVALVRPPGGGWEARFSGGLVYRGEPQPLELTIPQQAPPPEPQVVPAGHTIGPLTVDSLAVDFDGGRLHVRLNARLGRAGLAIDVIGLRLSIALDDPLEPEFAIDGLAVTYDIPPVTISGGLLFVRHPDHAQFDGSLSIRAGDYGLTALGSYAASTPPSLFAFLQVLVPIGGPPAFYVRGIAGGFGINRHLRLPAVEELHLFPLIRGSRTEEPFTAGSPVAHAVAHLDEHMSPLEGRDWVVAGVDVASFGVLATQALVTLSFGGRVEIGLLGIATLRFPPVGPQVVHARMALRTVISPAVGELSASAQLTSDSYVLDPGCQLTGGFAFCFWFAPHDCAGDFVITLGGYHPGFKVPAHYPSVPRLGVAWAPPLLPLTIKGSHYFALTPALVMTGGVLEANWDVDPIRARFTIQADFLARWAPFHYTLEAGVTFAVDARLGSLVRHTFSINVGAELKLWGPTFSGRAHVDLGVMGFTIAFGDAPEHGEHPPVGWEEFSTGVLGGQTLRVQVRDGLLATTEDGVQIVDPERFAIATDTAVPVKAVTVNGVAQALDTVPAFGITPMEIAPDALTSTHAVRVERFADGSWHPYDRLTVAPVTGRGPRALWGAPCKPAELLNKERSVEGLVSGLRLRPRGAVGDETDPVALGEDAQPGPTWPRQAPLAAPVQEQPQEDVRAIIARSIADPEVAARRARLVGPDFKIDVDALTDPRRLRLRAEPVLER